MIERKIPDYNDLATKLAISGEAVSRKDFEEHPEVTYFHNSADIGRIHFALRQAFCDGRNAARSSKLDHVRSKLQALVDEHSTAEDAKDYADDACDTARELLELLERPPCEHEKVPIDLDDVTEEDRAIVRDFYTDACHADWCEYDAAMLEYVAARSRLNAAAVIGGFIGMAEAIRRKAFEQGERYAAPDLLAVWEDGYADGKSDGYWDGVDAERG